MASTLSRRRYDVALDSGSKTNEKEKTSDSDMDAARNFLNALLQGDFKDASNYMLQDSTNTGYLYYTEKMYKKSDPNEKQQLKEASLRFYNHPNQKPNDSTTIIIYSNSYKNDMDTLKVLKTEGKWLVDLKYLFEHDIDTLFNKKIDTIHS